MIDLEKLEQNKEAIRNEYSIAKSFSNLAKNKFCFKIIIEILHGKLHYITSKSMKYVFVLNKFDKVKMLSKINYLVVPGRNINLILN